MSLISTKYKPLALLIIDKSGRIIKDISPVEPVCIEQEAGLTADLGATSQCIHELFHADIDIRDCDICNSIRQLDKPLTFFVSKGDQYFDIHLSPYRSNGNRTLILHSCYDATPHYLAEKNLKLINRLYNMLRLANQAIFKHTDENALLQELCDIAVNTGGFELSWFGVKKDEKVKPHVFGGKYKDYIDAINVDLTDPKQMNGPIARVFRSNSICYVNDISNDDIFKHWRWMAEEKGFKSVVVMPWKKNGLTIGVFALYSSEVDAFDGATLDMITELNHDLSHILQYMDAEKDRRFVEKQLFELSTALDQSKSAIMITDMKLTIEYVNTCFCTVSGINEQEILGRRVFEALAFIEESQKILDKAWSIVKSGKNWEGEILLKSVDGNSYWYFLTVAPVFSENGDMKQVIWTGRDNTELHHAQETILELAHYDSLTKLPNRRLHYENMSRAIARAEKLQSQFALLFFDIDGFKSVNDTMGHDYGDLLLQHMAEVLTVNINDLDKTARLGGDEFTIILEDVESIQQIEVFGKKIIDSLNKPTRISGSLVSISTSIGVSVYPVDGKDKSTLMKKADMAMYHAKSIGKNRLKIFDESIEREYTKRGELQNHIKSALKNNQFILNFQPQMCLNTNELVGVEALLRWQHPTLGWLSPDYFIPIAEQSDLIIDIDDWVLNSACSMMKNLIDKGFPPVKLAVNISAVYFKHSNELLCAVKKALTNSGLPADLLQLEMTEGSLIHDADMAVDIIKGIKGMGVSFAIDDFGTGYSSLAYIKRLPVDVIKIDRSFIVDLETDKGVRSIVEGVVNISHNLGLKVLAEGVETQFQLEHLASYGCDRIQGYLYAKPMAGNKLYEFYRARI